MVQCRHWCVIIECDEQEHSMGSSNYLTKCEFSRMFQVAADCSLTTGCAFLRINPDSYMLGDMEVGILHFATSGCTHQQPSYSTSPSCGLTPTVPSDTKQLYRTIGSPIVHALAFPFEHVVLQSPWPIAFVHADESRPSHTYNYHQAVPCKSFNRSTTRSKR